MPKNYSLIVTLPDEDPKMYELRGDRVGLGRSVDNQIRLKVKEVSSSHCELRKLAGGGYEVVDLDSTNGTRLNGKQVERHELADGDRLLVGEVVSLHFVELAAGEAPADGAVAAGEEGNRAAAAYAQMDKKLQSIEADIAAKTRELEAMQGEYEAKLAAYELMEASLKELEETLAAKRSEASGNSEEIRMLEMDLMSQTRRVEVLRTDLNGHAEQLEQLQRDISPALTPAVAAGKRVAAQQSAPADNVTPVVPVPMSASPHAPKPVATQSPPARQSPSESDRRRSAPDRPVATPTINPMAPPPTPEERRANRLIVSAPSKPKPKPKLGGNA